MWNCSTGIIHKVWIRIQSTYSRWITRKNIMEFIISDYSVIASSINCSVYILCYEIVLMSERFHIDFKGSVKLSFDKFLFQYSHAQIHIKIKI